MKLRKELIAGVLSVTMIATSLQFSTGSVHAEGGKKLLRSFLYNLNCKGS